ncbi:MAG: glycosyl hydrolase 53 family protein [Muribaculaceae bacterium]|nr:glycosyl hydrolase 53 family protein [Muribaculaceae bacterium]
MKNPVKYILAVAVMAMASQMAVAFNCDVNGDGVVTSVDITAIYNYLLNGDMTFAATSDVDGDGTITATDITIIYNYLLNGVTPEPLPERLVGGDISMLTKYEEGGAIYKDKNGNTISDILPYFKEQGWNAMRVRLFVNPENATEAEKKEGVVQDLNYVKALGKRIKDAGYALVLDLHYSDSWADPGKQTVPAAWPKNDVEALQDSVYNYTKHVMQEMIAAGAQPDFIQLGNEITGGMLWPTGQVYPTGGAPEGGSWENFAAYQHSASTAVRETSPQTKIILHVEMHNEYQPSGFFGNCENYSIDYDIMGLSYYSAYHGDFSKLNSVLSRMEAASTKPIMIMECGYGYAWALPGTNYNLTGTYPYSNEGQCSFTVAMIAALKQHSRVKGLFWWWPEANEYGINWQNAVTSSWWNGSLFDNRDGKAQNALYQLKQFIE